MKARHILTEKEGKIRETYQVLCEEPSVGWRVLISSRLLLTKLYLSALIISFFKAIRDQWLDDDKKVPPPKFGEIASKVSECSSAKAGGNLGW